ncbi:hypothetical protein VKT23_010122 [Stygiomarasmius scandens]|uniref:Uncharacterized protein n=1 Tax=Marasmiellus scandens TaxID=2682957 RepID=A0ABR1JCZ3_9AGAR
MTSSVAPTVPPAVSAPAASVPAASVHVASIPVASVPAASVPAASVPVASVPAASVPAASVLVTSVPVASVPVAPASVAPAVPLPSVIHASSPSTLPCQQSSAATSSSTHSSDQSRMQTRSQKQSPTVNVPSSDEVTTIPKPDGENGRPGRGGYALKTALNWNPKEYKKVQDFVRELISTTLPKNIHTPFTLQPPTILDPIRKQIVEKFPRLRQYEDNWATDDFIRAALKSRQIQLKNRKLRVQAAQGQAVLDMQQN